MWDPKAGMPDEERLTYIEERLPLLMQQIWGDKWEGATADVAWLLREIRVARASADENEKLMRLTFDTLLREEMKAPVGPATVGAVLKRMRDLGFDVASVVLQDEKKSAVVMFRDHSKYEIAWKK